LKSRKEVFAHRRREKELAGFSNNAISRSLN
jgi:hypothetical protein